MAISMPEGKYIYVQSAYAANDGEYQSAKAVLGKSWREVPDARILRRSCRKFANSEQRGKWWAAHRWHHSDGTVVRTEMAVTTLPDGRHDLREPRHTEQLSGAACARRYRN